MVTKTAEPTRFSTFLTKKLMESRRNQKEIAQMVGYKNQNMITMLKQGDSKLALDRVPAMARALEVDPLELFKIALSQFYDDVAVGMLISVIESGISPTEQKILEIAREASNGTPTLNPKREKALARIFDDNSV